MVASRELAIIGGGAKALAAACDPRRIMICLPLRDAVEVHPNGRCRRPGCAQLFAQAAASDEATAKAAATSAPGLFGAWDFSAAPASLGPVWRGVPTSDLRELVTRLAGRKAGRTEANVQSDLHMLLAAGPLDLGDDELQDIVLESPAGQRRRIDVENGHDRLVLGVDGIAPEHGGERRDSCARYPGRPVRRQAGRSGRRYQRFDQHPKIDAVPHAPMVWSEEIDFQAAYDASASTRAEAFAAGEAEVENSRRIEREAESLDLAGHQPRWGEDVSLRMVMLHVLLEYGRHNGHADFLREGVDGTAGA